MKMMMIVTLTSLALLLIATPGQAANCEGPEDVCGPVNDVLTQPRPDPVRIVNDVLGAVRDNVEAVLCEVPTPPEPLDDKVSFC